MVDDRTTTLNLPLPHPQNDLVFDVVRIRTALQMIDDAIEALRQQVAALTPPSGG
ncbi:hypothetical protein D3C76_1047400 [compost metagenome]